MYAVPNYCSCVTIKTFKLISILTIGVSAVAAILIFLTPNGFVGRSSGNFFTTSGGLKIFYSEDGAKSLPPVLLMHGFAVNGDLNWTISEVRSQLKEKYRLIIPDLRGHGLSDKPHEAAHYGAEIAKDMSELLHHLKVSQATIAGYSLGGFVALKFSQLFPEQTKNVIVMGAGWDEMGPDSLAERLKPAALALKSHEGIPPLATFLNPNKDPGMFHKLWVLFMTKFLNDPLALASLIDGTEGLTLTTGELASVQSAPCLIIGSEDPFYDSALKIKTILPQAELKVIQGKNHMSAVSSPELITNFNDCMLL